MTRKADLKVAIPSGDVGTVQNLTLKRSIMNDLLQYHHVLNPYMIKNCIYLDTNSKKCVAEGVLACSGCVIRLYQPIWVICEKFCANYLPCTNLWKPGYPTMKPMYSATGRRTTPPSPRFQVMIKPYIYTNMHRIFSWDPTDYTHTKEEVRLQDLPIMICKKRSRPDTAAGDEGPYFTFFTFTSYFCTLNADLLHFPQTHENDDSITISTLKKNFSLIVLDSYVQCIL